MTAEELIAKAKNRFPFAISYKGRITSEEMKKLEKHCIIHCPSVYMDGTAVYSIRYRKNEVAK